MRGPGHQASISVKIHGTSWSLRGDLILSLLAHFFVNEDRPESLKGYPKLMKPFSLSAISPQLSMKLCFDALNVLSRKRYGMITWNTYLETIYRQIPSRSWPMIICIDKMWAMISTTLWTNVTLAIQQNPGTKKSPWFYSRQPPKLFWSCFWVKRIVDIMSSSVAAALLRKRQKKRSKLLCAAIWYLCSTKQEKRWAVHLLHKAKTKHCEWDREQFKTFFMY